MARFYTTTSPVDSAVSGYMEGDKQRKDELFRQATLDMQKANARKDAEQFGIKDMSGYRSPKFDPSGNFAGYEENTANMDRNRPVLKAQLPEYFTKELNPAKPAAPDPQVELDRQTNEINARQEAENAAKRAARLAEQDKSLPLNKILPAGQRLPQSLDGNQPQAIKPLLASPEKDQLTPIEAPPKKVAPGVSIQPTDQKTNFSQGMDVSGPAVPDRVVAGTPAVNADYNPTPELMHDIQQRATTASAKDSDPLVPVNTLPPVLREKLGIGPDFQGGIRASILREMIQGSYRAVPKGEEPMLPETVDGISAIEQGAPLSSVMRSIMQKRDGESLPKRDQYALEKAYGQHRLGAQFNVGRTDKLEEKADRSVERFRAAYDKTGVLDALPLLQQIETETGLVSGQGKSLKKLPGFGTNIVSSLPLVGNAASTMMAKSYGGESVKQALQGLLNVKIKDRSGTAVSQSEMGRNLIESGMGPGGSEKDVARGISLMVDALKEADRSVRSAFDPSTIRTFQAQGGQLPLIDELTGGKRRGKEPSEKAPPKERNDYEAELKKSKDLLTKFEAGLAQNADMPAAQISSEVRKKKAQVDSFLKGKYGKGYRE